MPRSIVPATMVFICRLDDLASRGGERARSRARNSIRRAQAFGDRPVIAHAPARPISITEFALLAMAEDFEDLLNLFLTPEHRRQLVLAAREQGSDWSRSA